MNKIRILILFLLSAMLFSFANVSPAGAAGSIIHFDTNALALQNGDIVTVWGGQSAAGTPTFLTNQTPSGMPAVQFNGGGDRMGDNISVPASAAGDWILVAVIKPQNIGAYHNLADDDPSSRPMLWIDSNFNYELNFGGGSGAKGAGTGTDSWDIVIADSRLNQLYVNSPAPNASGRNGILYSATKLYDFFHRDGGQTYQGLVAELRIYNDRADFGGDFAALHSEMFAKYLNQPTNAEAGGPYLVAVEAQTTFDGSGSSDPDPADTLTETWTADGGAVAGNVYTAGTVPGIYDVQLVVNDGTVDSPPDDTIVVVYDPSGGFVTGGGWFDSPPGAYTPDDLTVFEANFDSGTPTEFSGSTTTEGVQGYAGYGTGSNVFGGDFLRNSNFPDGKTTLSLTGLPPHDSISLSYLLAIIDSWDGPDCGGDTFNVTVDGVSIFSEVFTNHSVCGLQTYIPPTGVELIRSTQLGFNFCGDGCLIYSDSAYDMGLDPTFQDIPHTSSSLTIEWFSGGGWQGGDDESWAIDNVVVLVADEDVTGKANFGFVAKYKKGANVPDGNTQFQFKAGDLNFHSSSYEWLVVAGDTAMFRGDGTINGEGSYTFMIWADDDNPDTFRIHIWGDNGTVYDNGSQQALGGGSIKVHQ